MSAIPLVSPADLPATRAPTSARRPRVWLRGLSFTALSLYGAERWGGLMAHPPGWRLLGMVLVASAIAVLVPLVRHLTADWPAHTGRIPVTILSTVLMLSALPIAGLRWQWVWHVRVAVSADAIGRGLNSLGTVLVPYLGHGYSTRLVILLGAAVLLLDAAAALAFVGDRSGEIGEGRRVAAALPLIALAVVPAALVPPRHPALQGLILFALVAVLVWGERIERHGRGAAAGLAGVAAIAGAIVGPLIAQPRPWVDYRAWAGSAPEAGVARFDWNQTYGPLRWPQNGRVMLSVRAKRSDYWKAQDLTVFNGTDWVAGPPASAVPALPLPSRLDLDLYLQAIQVTIDGMQTQNVIGGSGLTMRPQVAGGTREGDALGTWVANKALAPGDAYTVLTYSPTPSPAQLTRVSSRTGAYPWSALAPDLALSLPHATGDTPIAFGPFHTRESATVAAALARSPDAPAYRLARRLAARAATPYAYVRAVMRYLDSGRFHYDQRTQRSANPLMRFLLDTHAGYCQQFSGTMALLLRMGGVPARVAAGFTSGTFSPSDHTWTVTDTDAHAWVEAWFPQYGWVKFDPTPSSAPARGGTGRAGVAAPAAIHGSATPRTPAVPQRRASTTATTPHNRILDEPTTPVVIPRHAGPPVWPWLLGGAVAVLALLAGVRRALRQVTRRDPLSELEHALAQTGRPLTPQTTLAGLERRFHDSPEAAGYVHALRMSRYGAGGAASPTSAGRRAVRTELAAGLGLRGRLRAMWALPPRLG